MLAIKLKTQAQTGAVTIRVKVKKQAAPQDITLKSATVEIVKTVNNAGIATDFEIGVGLKMKDNVLSVDSATDYSGDNTRPVQTAFMKTQLGNIELLLQMI